MFMPVKTDKPLMMLIFLEAAVIAFALFATVARGQCPDGQCPTGPYQQQYGQAAFGYLQSAPRQTVRPSPAVVQIRSVRGDAALHGTGSIVAIDRGVATILTCAHILKDGYRPVVHYADGQAAYAVIVSADALTDAAVLRAKSPDSARYMKIDEPPQAGEIVSWCGYSGEHGYVSGSGRVVGYEGEFLLFDGNVPMGVSGGPIFTARGVVGVLSECRQMPGRPWRTVGASVRVIRRIVKAALPPYGKGKANVVLRIPLPTGATRQAAGNVGPADDACAPVGPSNGQQAVEIDATTQITIDARLDRIEKMIAALQTLPRPPGPAGPAGPPGKEGKAGPPGRDGKDAATVDYDLLAAEVLKRLPPIHVQVIRDGKVIEESDVFLGGTLPLRLVPVPVASPKDK